MRERKAWSYSISADLCATRSRYQLSAEGADKILLVARHHGAQPGHAIEGRPIRKGRSCIDRHAITRRSPLAGRIEILERETERIHAAVARRTRLPTRKK